MGGGRHLLKTIFLAALATMSVAGSVVAEEMSSSEIFRRMELQLDTQPSGGITRGLRLSYGEDETAPAASQGSDTTTYQVVREEARIDLYVYFEWNSAALKPQAVGQLSALCAAMKKAPPTQAFRIIGHTDKSGSDSYNLYLSRARAKEVKRHLIDECAMPSQSLQALGEGERQADPTAPERNPAERRVEVQLVI